MGVYKYIRNLWKKPKDNMPELMMARLIQWRKEPSTVRLMRPTRLDRARSLGYKAKPGFIVVRQKVARSRRMRPGRPGARRPSHNRRTLTLDKNYRQIAEERANKKYPNCEVLNSYSVADDGRFHWFEIILVDRAHPVIKNDPKIAWISEKRGRTYRGLTSAGKKGRGLRHKGKGAEQIRPSKNAAHKRKVSRPKKNQYYHIDN